MQNRILIIGVGVFASAHLTREGELLVWVLFILVRFFFSFVLFIIILLLLLLLITITIQLLLLLLLVILLLLLMLLSSIYGIWSQLDQCRTK